MTFSDRNDDRSGSPKPDGAALVSILFADIVNSTAQLPENDLEQARDALERAISIIRRRVAEYGGTVARVQGDGVMAIFGAPTPMEDHALCACCAAQKMCADFAATEQSAIPGEEFAAIRVGIHSGQVLPSLRLNDFGRDYDAVGKPVHIAASVEGVAEPNTVAITRETLDLAGPVVEAVPYGQVDAGGRRDVFKLLATNLDHGLERIITRGRVSPFVGREDLWQALLARIDAVRTGLGGAIAIVGEAGLGKSRLLYELAGQSLVRGFRILELRGVSVQSHTPFVPLRGLISQLLDVTAKGDANAIASSPHVAALPERLRPAALELAGVSTGDAVWNALDGPSRRRFMFEAGVALVERAARRGPCLIVAEDVHHLDSETIDFLASLKSVCGGSALALIVSGRNSGRAAATRIADEVIELKPLTAEALSELGRALAEGTGVGNADVARAVQRASGNPLFLQEIVRGMQEARVGRGDSAPLSVIGLIQARMGALSATATRVARAAGVLGDNIDRGVLARTAKIDESLLPSALEELERLEIIDASDTAQVRFRHEVFADAVQDTLLRGQRIDLHRSALAAMEATQPQTGLALEQLAHHAASAGEIARALTHILAACGLAAQSSSLKTVRKLYDWAMRLKEKAGPKEEPLFLQIAVAAFDALQQSGDVAEYRRALDYVLAYATGRDRRMEGLARAHLSLIDWMQADRVSARRNAEVALKLALELDDLFLRSIAQPNLSNIEHAEGNVDRAIALLVDMIDALAGEHERSTFGRMIIPSVRSCAFAAWFMADRGGFDEAQRLIERGEATLSSVDQPYSRVLINAARGILAIRRGKPLDALTPLEHARDLCFSLQFYIMEPCISGWLATALVLSGTPEKARAIAQHSIDAKLYLHGGRYTWVYIHQGLAEAQFACGDGEGALQTIRHAIAIAEQSKEPIHVAQARLAYGLMLAARGEADQARDEITQALGLGEQLGLGPLATECRRALAGL